MVTLEQIKLLESKIIKAIDIVNRLNEEKSRLKKRNEELEALVEGLKDEKSRVEEGIISALDRLNQFEDTIERSISAVKTAKPAVPAQPAAPTAQPQPFAAQPAAQPAPARPAVPPQPVPASEVPSAYTVDEEEEEEISEIDEEISEDGEAELDIF
jgi:uncharacterized phage infection (PIP) family protein YhgE